MKFKLLLLAFLGSGFLVGLGSTASAQTTPGNRSSGAATISSRTKRVQVIDPALEMVAYTFTIPEDWKFEGTVLRGEACNTTAAAVVYRISSPDGITGIQQMPQFNWFWGDSPATLAQVRSSHCKVMLPMNSNDFGHYIVPVVRANARPTETQPSLHAADWANMIRQQNAMSAQQHGYGLAPTRVTGDSSQIHVEYSLQGTPVEEWLVVDTQCFDNVLPAGYGTAAQHSYSSTAYVWGRRARRGQLAALDQTLRDINGSAVVNPEWNQRQAALIRDQQNRDNERVRASIKRAGEDTAALLKQRHEANLRASADRVKSAMKNDQDKMDVMDRSAAAYTLYAGDEQLMRNPQTGEVGRVSSNYSQGWQATSGGATILSNSPDFNPNVYLRGSWTQLDPISPLDR
jgi:hypothetical protein